MKIFIICSKRFYSKVPDIKNELEQLGHIITLPNSFEDPTAEARHKELGNKEYAKWKSDMLKHSADIMHDHDSVLVLNFEKDGVENYIGGATFLEIYEAFKLGKKIFIYNDIPVGILTDEIIGFSPIIINSRLELIGRN